MIDAASILAQRYEPASFNGIAFDVVSRRRLGRNNTTTVRVTGRGAREKLTTGGDPDGWAITAWLRRDEGPWADEEALARALHLDHDHDATGLYIDPFDGPQRVVPIEWTFESESDDLNALRLSITFRSAELPIIANSPGFLAETPAQFVDAIAKDAGEFANEEAPAAQFEALRAEFGIESSTTGSAYATESSRRLLTTAPVATAGAPLVVQDLGAAARTAALGEYTRPAWGALRDRLIQEAARSNSPTLIKMRETLTFYLSALGADAFGTTASKPGRSLITVASSRSWPETVRRNRDAVIGWLAQDEVAL